MGVGLRALVVTAVAALLLPLTVHAELRFGMVAPFSGDAASLGEGMKRGVEAHFREVNAAGGVHGHELVLETRDDGYDPDRSGPATRELLEDGVIGMIGNVGTPTARITIPIHNDYGAVLFGAFTGAGILRRDPPDRYVINFRASYAQETAAMIDGLIGAGVEPEEIAFFTQNDSFGDAGYQGAMEALEAHGVDEPRQLGHGRYTRNTRNIHRGLAEILRSEQDVRAIVMVGTYAPAAEFIRAARQDFRNAVFLNVSFVGSHALVDALDGRADDVVVTQVVPPYTSDLPAVEAYRDALATHDPDAEPDFVSLEGYLAARVLARGLDEAGARPDREAVVDGLLGLGAFDIGLATELRLAEGDHQASDAVWPTRVRDGEFEPVEWSELF